MIADVIDLTIGPLEDGKMVFRMVNDKWRCAAAERRRAHDDTQRIKKKREAKERL